MHPYHHYIGPKISIEPQIKYLPDASIDTEFPKLLAETS